MRIGSEGKRWPRRCAVILCGAIFFAALPAARAADPPSETSKYTGPGSCSSTSCHGSVKPRADSRIFQDEYSIWVVKDKHAKAYEALTGPVGERMGRILGLGKSERAAKCLACHALDVPADARAKTFELNEGVTCESCHGPSSAWLGPHTTHGWTHEQSVAAGMYDTRNLIRRAEKCLSCHLGTQERFVDHEMIAAGHPECKYVSTVCMSYGLQAMNSVRKALSIGGPTFIHSLDPCPKGWDYDPIQSHELGELAVTTGIWPLYEVENGVLRLVGKTREIAARRYKRGPVRDYLLRQGRFAHFTDEDIDYFQKKIDEMWEKWLIPGVIPFRTEIENWAP